MGIEGRLVIALILSAVYLGGFIVGRLTKR